MKQIYVHGLGQTSDSWTKTIDILQTTDYSLCPNLPDLVHSKEVTYDNLYAAFSDYCNQYDEPIDLCGLSLGGVLALNYAIQYPKKVHSWCYDCLPLGDVYSVAWDQFGYFRRNLYQKFRRNFGYV